MKTARANRLKNKNLNLAEEKSRISISQKAIYDIYKKEFIDECENIIIEKQKEFLQKYFSRIHLIIKSEYGNDIFEQNSQINEIIKKCEIDFTNEVYNPMYNSCSFALKKYNSTKIRNLSKEYLTNFLPHCSFDQVPLHTCGSKFIFVNNINNKNRKINKYSSYVLCIGCHKCYYDSCIRMYCPFCQMKFYSYLIEKNPNNLYPATWKKYHCDDYMNNEQMTCIKCENKFWVKDNVLICKNCKLEVKPEEIIWTCIICKSEFKSKVKIYNELEFKEINYEIKNALLYKRVAKPNELPCKCLSPSQIINTDFYHKLNECKGILYYGRVENREFVVCSLCKMMTYLNKFHWNCPICKISFVSRRIKYIPDNNGLLGNNILERNSINENNFQIRKYKRSQEKFYSHIPNLNISNNNAQRQIKKNDSYVRKCIGSSSSSKHNTSKKKMDISKINTEQNDKKRNNSLIVSTRNASIFNFDNNIIGNINNTSTNIGNIGDKGASQGYYHLIQENKNNTSSSTVYSSVSYYNNNTSREREKDSHKKINENNNPTFKFNCFSNKISEKKDISFTVSTACNNNKKNNLTLNSQKDNILNHRKSNNNYIYEYNTTNNTKKDIISSFNIRKGKEINKNNVLNKNNVNSIQSLQNKVYVPKKNISSNLSICTNDEENISNHNRNSNISESRYNHRFNLKTNDTQENNILNNPKLRNFSGPKINENNIYINSKYREIMKNNNYEDIRQSSQPKIDSNKINNIRRNKILNMNKEDSLSKSLVSDISDNVSINNLNNDNNKSKNKLYNKNKDYYYKRRGKKEEITITNITNSDHKKSISYIEKTEYNLQKRRDTNRNNAIKYLDNSIEGKKNLKNNSKNIIKSGKKEKIEKIEKNNKNEEKIEKNNKSEEKIEENDELKEFNFDDYKIITQLGQGTFGKIYLVQDPQKQLYSMKKIVLSEELDVQSVIKEYRMCYKIKHPNVIKILGVYNNKLDKTTYVVYVLMEVGLTDWEKEIKSYSDKHLEYTEAELINIIKQLTSVLAFLQRKNISHRDIKPQNILVFKNNIYKIADFGEAKQIESISKSIVVNSLRGTELYMSPLLFNGLRTGQVDIKHNMFKSDVYSFGLCILYAAVTNNKPLYETRKFVEMNSVKKYVNKILKNKYSSKFIQLLCTMIEIHEKNRPDFIELENIMKNWKN